jgi:hypothetical protein
MSLVTDLVTAYRVLRSIVYSDGPMLSPATKAFVGFAGMAVCAATLHLGCSSSELMVCKNPPPKEAACIDCLNANCSEVVQNIESDCSSLLSCTQNCECGNVDDECLSTCNLMTCDGGDFGACPACSSVCAGVAIGL